VDLTPLVSFLITNRNRAESAVFAVFREGFLVSYNGNTDWIRFVGKPHDGKHIEVNERDVSAGYFQTIGARGRR
jgi:hypothetical protein